MYLPTCNQNTAFEPAVTLLMHHLTNNKIYNIQSIMLSDAKFC